jgi:hypothetical protein
MTGYKDIKEYRKNTKIKLVEGFGSQCTCCGLVDDHIVYDFHHIDPTQKDFQISTSKRNSWEAFKEEAKKCIMVCVICHRKIHAGIIEVPENPIKFDESRIQSTKEHYNVGLHNRKNNPQHGMVPGESMP